MKRQVALKFIGASAASSETARRRFDREVKLTSLLQHPHIGRIYDSGILDGKFYYAMELIEGRPLDEYIAQEKLRPRQVLQLMLLVCRALEHAHAQGVIHRDLKPSNILIGKDGQPHVLDFGLAKSRIAEEEMAGISLEGETAGTVAYMSPEQAGGDVNLNVQSDVYSLGVILYCLLVGEPPHDLSGNFLQVMRRVREMEVRRPRTVNKTLDREIEALLLRALEKNPVRRYPSAGALADDIDNYLNRNPLTAKTPTLSYFIRKRVSKYRVPVAVVSGVVLALLTMAIYSYIRVGRERDTAIAERTKAELRLADGLIFQGDVLGREGSWEQARQLYEQSEDLFRRHRISSNRAQLGLWQTHLNAPLPLREYQLSNTRIVAIAMLQDKDNQKLAIACGDNSVRVLDMPTGRELERANSTSERIAAIAAGDGNDVVFVDAAGHIHTLDASKPRNDINGGAGVTALLRLPGRAGIVTFDDSSNITWRDDQVVKAHISFAGHINQAAMFPDARHVALAADHLTILDLWGKDPPVVLNQCEDPTTVAISPDGQTALCGFTDGGLKLWDLGADKPRASFTTNAAAICAVAFINGQQQAVSVDERGTVAVWSLAPPQNLIPQAPAPTSPATTAPAQAPPRLLRLRREASVSPDALLVGSSISTDGTLCVTARADGRLVIWDLTDDAILRRVGTFSGPAQAAFLAAPAADQTPTLFIVAGILHAWHASSGAPATESTPATSQPSPLNTAAGCTDASVIAIGLANEITLREVGSTRSIHTFKIDVIVERLALNRDATVVAALSRAGQLFVADTTSNAIRPIAADSRERFSCLTLSPDGSLLLAGSADRTLLLYDLHANQPIHLATVHKAAINAVAISRDGRYAASAGGVIGDDFAQPDNSIWLWDIAARKTIARIGQHSQRVRRPRVSPRQPDTPQRRRRWPAAHGTSPPFKPTPPPMFQLAR